MKAAVAKTMKINSSRISVAAWGIVLMHSVVAQAATYYVSSAGAISNSGTSIERAFLTIQKAAAITNPGDTVYVMGGTYEPIVISHSGSASRGYITYKAYPGEHPTILKTSKVWDGIQILGKTSYIIIDGFAVVGNAKNITLSQAQKTHGKDFMTNGNCIGIGDTSHHILIRNNELSYCPGGGIVAGGDYLYIYKNKVHHNAYVSVRKEVESLESVVILCQAPALEVLYVDIEEPLPV